MREERDVVLVQLTPNGHLARNAGDDLEWLLCLARALQASKGVFTQAVVEEELKNLRVMKEMQWSESAFPTAEQIEQRAYELYLERGGGDGDDLADWFAAKKELTEPPGQVLSVTPKARAAAGASPTLTKAGRAGKEASIE
jgi:hypothetical protein